MNADDEDHKFDRRGTDANVAALSVRVRGLEGRVGLLEDKVDLNSRELIANTALTKQVHQNTEAIVEAVTWLSTTKKVMIVGITGVGGLAAAGTALVAFLKNL
jgi:hypothetical protein